MELLTILKLVTAVLGILLFLFGLIALVPLIKSARKKNEDALREQVKTTNRWALVDLSHKQRQPSQWTA